jgi:hypothetical protein
MEYLTGRTVQTTDMTARQLQYLKEGREDLVEEGTRNLPAWAEGNPHTYFRTAEERERANGVAFEEFKITLPYELTRVQNQALVQDLLDAFAGDRLPCTYAFHQPKTLDGMHDQAHIHLLISARMNDEHARTAETHFRRYNAAHPERGGAQKDQTMNVYHATKLHRLMISDLLNVHLERYGHTARVHPESLKSRGIAREPEPKLLPSESAAYRNKGVVSPKMAEVLAIRQARAKEASCEQENARAYWEARKAFLGVTRGMTPREKVAQILLKRHGHIERVPARDRQSMRPAPTRYPRQTRTRDLAQELRRLTMELGRGTDETELARGGVRVRLGDWDREGQEEKEAGLGW